MRAAHQDLGQQAQHVGCDDASSQEGRMARGRRRKCKCCRKLFRPDPRNLRHQRYCSKPSCRAARKAASQARWLAQPENHDYFRGPVHLAAAGPGERVIPAIGVSPRAPALRLKTSQQRKLLVPLAKLPFSCVPATRSLNGTTRCSDWLNCPSRGTRNKTTSSARPIVCYALARHSGHVPGTGRSAP